MPRRCSKVSLPRVLPVLGGVGALGEVLESFRMTRSEGV